MTADSISATAPAEGKSPGKSPAVFRNLTQAELDKAYTQTEWAPNSREILKLMEDKGAAVRDRMPPQTFAYGPHPDETLDVFGAAEAGAGLPIHVHLHGGAWKAQTKEDASYAAPLFVDRGAIYIALNFSVIPTVRLPEMVAQTERAVVWIYHHARGLGGDPERIHVSGHSAGGHMAACLLTTLWQPRFGIPSDVLKTGLLMSGGYDLEAVMLSVRSSYVKLSKEEEWALSAPRHADRIHAPVVLGIGGNESPEFKRQADDFLRILQEHGRSASLVHIPDCNHYEMMDVFGTPGSPLADAALQLMRL